jgi:hypothetical protein
VIKFNFIVNKKRKVKKIGNSKSVIKLQLNKDLALSTQFILPFSIALWGKLRVKRKKSKLPAIQEIKRVMMKMRNI